MTQLLRLESKPKSTYQFAVQTQLSRLKYKPNS